jgi:ribonuclease VapC
MADDRQGFAHVPACNAIRAGSAQGTQARIARDAYSRFGKGNHPAGLNFGDCFAYALAKERDLPLLYKGADFAQTDVTPALS